MTAIQRVSDACQDASERLGKASSFLSTAQDELKAEANRIRQQIGEAGIVAKLGKIGDRLDNAHENIKAMVLSITDVSESVQNLRGDNEVQHALAVLRGQGYDLRIMVITIEEIRTELLLAKGNVETVLATARDLRPRLTGLIGQAEVAMEDAQDALANLVKVNKEAGAAITDTV